LIFPEGTRTPDGRLQPFKVGIGLLARELELPVLPIHLAGLHAILPKGRVRPRQGPATVSVGEPIRVSRDLGNTEAAARLAAAVERLAPRPAILQE
jgi:1-acyl-sn-glycerol-3-phosphate acyltransferase